MIENDTQYQITQTKLKEFKASVAELNQQAPPTNRNEELRLKCHIDSLNSFIEELQEDIEEYKRLNNDQTN